MLDRLQIAPADPGPEAEVRRLLAAKAMPPGALGRIGGLAEAMARAGRTAAPSADPAHLLIFAGDHGLVAEGVSAWPQEVTALMVRAFLDGGAAAPVLARSVGARVTVCDAGVAAPLPDAPGLVSAGIRPGTRNAAREDALTAREVEAALDFGAAQAQVAARAGARVIALGEMGIGNTASAALVAHAVTGIDLARLVGPGAGLDPDGVARKRQVLERCLARRRPDGDPLAALAAFGGLEIAAMAGAALAAAAEDRVVLIDGFIATAAVVAALSARPEARRCCIFAHVGAEPGHRPLLDHLGEAPLLDLGLRLGEGTGALLALPLLRAAAAVLAEMATLADVGAAG